MKNFMERCFERDPKKRASADDLLNHCWLKARWTKVTFRKPLNLETHNQSTRLTHIIAKKRKHKEKERESKSFCLSFRIRMFRKREKIEEENMWGTKPNAPTRFRHDQSFTHSSRIIILLLVRLRLLVQYYFYFYTLVFFLWSFIPPFSHSPSCHHFRVGSFLASQGAFRYASRNKKQKKITSVH